MDNSNHDRHDPLFAALRDDIGKLDTPSGVEQALLHAFAQRHPRRRWYQVLAPRDWTLAGGVAAACAAVVLVAQAPQPVGEHAPGVAQDGVPFIALAPAERIAQEPAPHLVVADVPRSSLATLGVPLTPENAGDDVRAEWLVAADGQPLALRLTTLN